MKKDSNALFKHRTEAHIRFNDVDMFAHLNNTVYVEFFDQAKYAYFRQFMDGTFGSTSTAPVIVNINVDFLEAAHLDDKLTVATSVTAISDTSLTFEQYIEDEQGNIKSRARTIMVNLDMKTGEPTSVDDDWRRKIGEYEQRDFCKK